MSGETQIYHPELLPRRGEITAWSLAVVSFITMLYLNSRGITPSWVYVFIFALGFSALSISLGNWMDRHTRISIDSEAVSFSNGLRDVRLPWVEITEVRVLPARWGEAVQVIGEKAHFEFKTLGEVKFQGETQGRVGFVKGSDIRDNILRAARLTTVRNEDSRSYYSRL